MHLSRLVCKNRFDANQRTQSDDAYRGCVSWTYTRKKKSKDRPFIFDIERSSYRRKTRHVVNVCLPRLTYNEITCCWPATHLWHLACCFLSTWSLAYVCIQRYRVVATADFAPHLLCFLFWNGGTLNQQFLLRFSVINHPLRGYPHLWNPHMLGECEPWPDWSKLLVQSDAPRDPILHQGIEARTVIWVLVWNSIPLDLKTHKVHVHAMARYLGWWVF